jgi:hypothetical protein
MKSAEEFPPQQLVGRAVAFCENADHEDCWHHQVGLKTGVVLKVGPSLAQKAALMGAEGDIPPELLTAGFDVPRLWVRADPCAAFPRGCEAAVEPACLLVIDPKPSSK